MVDDKRRMSYIMGDHDKLSKENKDFILYLMYGSFRRLHIDDTEKLIVIEKRSPAGEFSRLSVPYADLYSDSLPELTVDACNLQLEDFPMKEGASRHTVLQRLLASKVKFDTEKFITNYK